MKLGPPDGGCDRVGDTFDWRLNQFFRQDGQTEQFPPQTGEAAPPVKTQHIQTSLGPSPCGSWNGSVVPSVLANGVPPSSSLVVACVHQSVRMTRFFVNVQYVI